MATRTKTVAYPFEALASVTDKTVTNFTQITVDIPESGLTFQNAWVEISADDIITVTGGTITEWRVGLRLAAVAYTTVTNLNDITHSGDNMSVRYSQDFTSHFATNWSGSSMTCDVQVYFDQSTGTTLGFVNVCGVLYITYDYDDTSATQVKTFSMPLNAPVGALATAKPGTATATIPILDTLFERGFSIKHFWVEVEGNTHHNLGTSSPTISLEWDTVGAHTTGIYEGALASDRRVRYLYKRAALSTSAAHDFFIWAAAAQFHHLCVTVHWTYTFTHGGPVTTAWAASTAKSVNDKVYGTNASGKDIAFICTTGGTTGGTEPTWNTAHSATTTDGTVTWTVLSAANSAVLCAASPVHMGQASGDFARMRSTLLIPEPGPLANTRVAAIVDWSANTTLTGFNMRVGTGSFVTYTDALGVGCGSDVAMVRNDITLARGSNTLRCDVYATGGFVGRGLGVRFLACWGSAQHRLGIGAHTATLQNPLVTSGTDGGNSIVTVTGAAATIAPTAFYACNVGIVVQQLMANASIQNVWVEAERQSGAEDEGWHNFFATNISSDAENGVQFIVGNFSRDMQRWPGDPDTYRLGLETSRQWRIVAGGGIHFWSAVVYTTFHSLIFTVTGTISGSAGGTVNVGLHRPADALLTGSRVGNGAYSLDWYDPTENLFVHGREDATHVGASETDAVD